MDKTLYQDRVSRLLHELDKVVVGKHREAQMVLAALIAGGHVLLNDVPGVAKTRLVRSLARLSDLSFARIQGTPDLLPSEVTGAMVYQPQTGALNFRPGPVFHNLVLVDEINRATPRTQSALLECMEERQVSTDGESHPLPEPFMVLATQNPIEMEGTFPLPEAQLDRFLLSFSLGYPTAAEEIDIATRFSASDPLDLLHPVLDAAAVSDLRRAAETLSVADAVLDYVVRLCRQSRDHSHIRLGASPRATIQFVRALKAYALVVGDRFVTPDHVKALAVPVLAHRLVLSADAEVERQTADAVVGELLEQVPVPVETA